MAINDRIEAVILKYILFDADYAQTIINHIRSEFFFDKVERSIFIIIKQFYDAHESIPTKEIVAVELGNSIGLANDAECKKCLEYLSQIKISKKRPVDKAWLLEQTEKWCLQMSCFLATQECSELFGDVSKKIEWPKAVDIMTRAVSISFSKKIGHSYVGDIADRWNAVCKDDKKVLFDLQILNEVTRGGVASDTLNVFLGATGKGKTHILTHLAASNIMNGKDTLYVTMEDSDLKIASRIDANLMQASGTELSRLSWEQFQAKFAKVVQRIPAKFKIVKLRSCTTARDIRVVLSELKLRESFVPEVLYIDHLTVMKSNNAPKDANSYAVGKAVAEEVRDIATDFDIPVMTAVQTNRSGLDSERIKLSDVAESYGVATTADFIIGLTVTPAYELQKVILLEVLKNRYGYHGRKKLFFIGMNRERQSLFDVPWDDQSSTVNSINGIEEEEAKDDGPLFDKSSCGQRIAAERPDIGSRKSKIVKKKRTNKGWDFGK